MIARRAPIYAEARNVMATGVGLRIADDGCTAAVVTDGGDLHYVERDCVLHMSDDGDTVLGGEAPEGHSHSITGFVAKVGDPAGIPVDDGEAYRAEDLVATALFCLINLTTEHLSGAAEFYATHPGTWPAPLVQALREALDYLGLRSVVLVSEADLPAVDTAEPGKAFAYDAARAALAAVLSTPAGAAPPDPGSAENSTVVTDVIPAVPAPQPTPQAYSAAMPAADAAPPAPAATEVMAGPQTVAAPPTAATAAPTPSRRIPILIAAAALIGLALGGVGVALLFRGEDSPAPPTLPDARSDTSTTVVAPPPPPTTQPPVTLVPAPAPAPPPEPEPEPATPEPAPEPTTAPPVTTTPEPTTTTRSKPTTTTRRNPFVPFDPEDWRQDR
ncbi:hypothetical protein IU443_13270 [Nocardia farcinica]|nr:hypothetical protein [Nocardia farcinica]MBF6251451.1 hypothetical protein [Nocardia farcinica]MBF6265090.1 hypothetical protein [Nocardia farcinica]MBF6282950.1 hypothetical protein [Nocardia farcinica]MBF6307754.1 hypothetical protein [Nocardia farcinica]